MAAKPKAQTSHTMRILSFLAFASLVGRSFARLCGGGAGDEAAEVGWHARARTSSGRVLPMWPVLAQARRSVEEKVHP